MINDIKTALELWDALNDDAIVFVPIVLNTKNSQKLFYIEAGQSDKSNLLLRVFINREEADTYKIKKRNGRMTLAKTTVGYLMSALDRNLMSEVDKDIDCVLSTLDMEGNFHSIETIWSNTKKPL